MHGFVKTAIITPTLKVGNPFYNISEMLLSLEGLESSFAIFPELSVTGYTAGDLFLGNKLLDETKEALSLFIQDNPFPGVVMIGAPFEYKGALYNCAFVIQKTESLELFQNFIYQTMKNIMKNDGSNRLLIYQIKLKRLSF